jgi:hypothetical protein
MYFQRVLSEILADIKNTAQQTHGNMAGLVTSTAAGGGLYCTAVAVQVMCFPKRFRPIYQR